MKTKKKPFQSHINYDSVDIICPCGECISGEGESIARFKKQHLKHTNGKTKEHITLDGMRAYS